MKLVNQIERTTANFVVNPADVFSQQSGTNQLDAAQKQDGEKSPDVSCSGDNAEKFEMENGVTQIHDRKKQRERQYDSTQDHPQPQRLIAEAENRIHGVLKEPGKRLLGFTRGTSGPLVIHNRRGKADPCAQSWEIAVPFRKIIDGVSCLTI